MAKISIAADLDWCHSLNRFQTPLFLAGLYRLIIRTVLKDNRKLSPDVSVRRSVCLTRLKRWPALAVLLNIPQVRPQPIKLNLTIRLEILYTFPVFWMQICRHIWHSFPAFSYLKHFPHFLILNISHVFLAGTFPPFSYIFHILSRNYTYLTFSFWNFVSRIFFSATFPCN